MINLIVKNGKKKKNNKYSYFLFLIIFEYLLQLLPSLNLKKNTDDYDLLIQYDDRKIIKCSILFICLGISTKILNKPIVPSDGKK